MQLKLGVYWENCSFKEIFDYNVIIIVVKDSLLVRLQVLMKNLESVKSPRFSPQGLAHSPHNNHVKTMRLGLKYTYLLQRSERM